MKSRRWLILAVGLGAAALAGGLPSCSAPPTCASTCKGCCSSDGTCDAFGDTTQRCGANGAACQTCGAGQTCSAGACSGAGGGGGSGGAGGGTATVCDQTNCGGCCDAAGKCQLGLSATACGYGGACKVCVGSQSCVGIAQPTCVDTNCPGCSGADGGCINAITDAQCGSNGTACFSCAAAGATCNTANGSCTGGVCGGCRNAVGVCFPGSSKGACGSGGTQCAVCGTNQICVNAQCVAGGTGGGAGGGAGGGMAGGAGGAGGFAMDIVPSPGAMMNAEWTDIEPNDRPSQAVPVGTVTTVWAGFVMPYTTINSATDKDYFVFRTGTATQLQTSSLLLCWTGMFNLLDMYLYTVDAQQHPGPLVRSWTTTTPGCETAYQSNGADAGMLPNTVYLLEVRAAPGAVTPTQYTA